MSKELHQSADLIIGQGYVRVDLPWTEFKKQINGTYKSLTVQFVEDADRYRVFALDEGIVYVCDLVKTPANYDETFSSQTLIDAHNAERTEFENTWKNKGNKPTKSATSKGMPVVSIWPTEGTRKTFITGNWCDKTTWYQKAVRVVDEVATCNNVGTYTQYGVSHTYLIDTYHGKISQEDFLKDASNNSYRVVVKVNDVVKTEQDPHLGSGGDYTINYATGVVTFLSPLLLTDVVKVTYHYANGSEFVVKPDAGKVLKIRTAEVQFTKDIVITDTVKFQLYVGGSPYTDPVTYKTLMDYINEANGAYPEIAAMGGSSWRNLPQAVVTFPWNYQAVTELKSSLGMEIRIKLEHELPFTGTTATATFYCLSENE
jgi:hypothetical protein